jgi:hypothetical protein
MDPKKQIIAIARLHGWEGVPCEQSWHHHLTYGSFWRSIPPKCAQKYESAFTSSRVKRWLKMPDGSIFVTKGFAGNVNHKDTYAFSPVLEYFKGGWAEQIDPWPKLKPDLTYFLKYLPNYLEDLNLIRGVVFELIEDQLDDFISMLEWVVEDDRKSKRFNKRLLIKATAAQWCEAYLRVNNLWENS